MFNAGSTKEDLKDCQSLLEVDNSQINIQTNAEDKEGTMERGVLDRWVFVCDGKW